MRFLSDVSCFICVSFKIRYIIPDFDIFFKMSHTSLHNFILHDTSTVVKSHSKIEYIKVDITLCNFRKIGVVVGVVQLGTNPVKLFDSFLFCLFF